MRRDFFRALCELARTDSRVCVVSPDMGFGLLEPFVEEHPDRFVNCGVAEPLAVGVATGLAAMGKIPFVYTISTFLTLRAFEVIRNGPLIHGLPVRLIGSGGGLEYGHDGLTHEALEDLCLMRSLPGMGVFAPSDGAQAIRALRQTLDWPGPVYFRLGRYDRPALARPEGPSRVDAVEWLRRGDDALLVTTGVLAHEVVQAADRLAGSGIDTAVALVECIAPAPETELLELLMPRRRVFVLEEHGPVGGLGSLVAGIIATHGLDCRLEHRCGRLRPRAPVSPRGQGLRAFGLDPEGIHDWICRQSQAPSTSPGDPAAAHPLESCVWSRRST